MKILHTADWHIGSKLQGKSRKDEQQAVIDEIVNIAKAEDVDAVFVCGDVFHHNYSCDYAEKMIVDALIRLADGGRRCVVAITGNHDDAVSGRSPFDDFTEFAAAAVKRHRALLAPGAGKCLQPKRAKSP